MGPQLRGGGIMRRIARRLAKHAAVGNVDDNAVPNVLAQVQAEAASTWRAPSGASAPVRGAERLRAWCEVFSLHAGVVIAEHDRDALERLCRYGTRSAFALERLPGVRSLNAFHVRSPR